MLLVSFVSFFVFCSCNSGSDSDKTSTINSSNATIATPETNSLKQLIDKYPDSAALKLRLAIAFDSLGNYAESLSILNNLIAKDSLNFGLWFTSAQVAEDAGDTALAMKHYERALSIYPSADAVLSLANLYAEQKNPLALNLADQVGQLRLGREYDAHTAFIRGVYYSRTGNNERAINNFDSCITSNYTYMPAYIEKGLVYFHQGKYRDALPVFQFASQVNGLDANPFYWQARCYENLNIKDSAIMLFKKSYQLEKAPETKEAIERVSGN